MQRSETIERAAPSFSIIQSIIATHHRLRTVVWTGTAIQLTLIILATTSLYAPIDAVSRVIFIAGVGVSLACAMIRTHHARRGLQQLEFDRQFVTYSAAPVFVGVSLRPDAKIWTRSHVVQSIRTLGYGPGMKIRAGSSEELRLRSSLTKLNSTIRWNFSVLDAIPLGLFGIIGVFATDIPFQRDIIALSVVSGTLLVMMSLLIGLQTRAGLRYNRRLSRLEIELADWTRNLINGQKVDTPFGYDRNEFFTAQAWFDSGRRPAEVQGLFTLSSFSSFRKRSYQRFFSRIRR